MKTLYFPVRNWRDAQLAWYIIHDYKNRKDKQEEIADLKREVREYMNLGPNAWEFRVVKDYGCDGLITLEKLPENIIDYNTAVEWFKINRVYEYIPSQYDCTGQLFTNYFKVFKRNGNFWAYHSVSCDV